MNPGKGNIRVTAWSFAVVAGILQVWSSRFYIEPDAVNYLDIASAYRRGDWLAAINGYWSPLYSWLLLVLKQIFRPSAYWESTFLHLLNFLLFLLALSCFEFFFGRFLSLLRVWFPVVPMEEDIPEWAWWVMGYAAFLLAALRLITLKNNTPDMALAAWLFLATGLLIQIALNEGRIFLYHAAFGIVLGAAYLTKSVMFPLSFLYICAGASARAGVRKPDWRGLVALFTFVLVSLPFITALSVKEGHFTFGETGRTAYFDQVTGPSNESKPLHPMRKLSDQPSLYEYADSLRSTFPPWYDGSYWYAGVRFRFNLGNQLRAIGRSISSYFHIVSTEKEWIAGWLFLAIFAADWLDQSKRLFRLSFLWMPSLAMLSLYALVLVEPRYVAVPLAIVGIVLFASLPWPRITATRRLGTAVFLTIGITTGITLIRGAIPDLAACLHPTPHVQWLAAKQLEHLGLAPGDRVAVLGHTTVADYWAQLAGLRIVADVPVEAVSSYWEASPEKRAEIAASLSALGVKAFVSAVRPPPSAEWQPLGQTGYFVEILQNPIGIKSTSNK